MLIPCALLGAVLIKRFIPSRNLGAASWAVIVAFVLAAPLTFVTSPSLPIDAARAVIATQEAGTNEAVLTTVSSDAYSVWPLVTGLVDNRHGLERSTLSSYTVFISNITYQQAGQYCTGLLLLLTGLALLLHPGARRTPGYYMPLLALGTAAFLMFLTGIAPTHFIIALPLILLCWKYIPKPLYLIAAILWTATTITSMYGSLAFALAPVSALAPTFADLGITHLFMQASRNDAVITGAVVANLFVMVCLIVGAAAAWIQSARNASCESTPAIGLQ